MINRITIFLLFIVLPYISKAQNIAIIEAGLHKDYRPTVNSIYEACVSRNENRYADVYGTATSYWYKVASACNNGLNILSANQASVIPREILSYKYRSGSVTTVRNSDLPNNWQSRHHQANVNKVVRETFNTGVANIKTAVAYPKPGAFLYQGYSRPSDLHYGFSKLETLEALRHVSSIAYSKNISAVVLSFSFGNSGHSPIGCQTPLRATIEQLRSQGVAVVIASGNQKEKNGVSFPACIEDAITVGATDGYDRIYNTSNSAPGLDFVAFSHVLDPFDGIVKNGTSYAAPRIAAYIARLKAVNRFASLERIIEVMHATGTPIQDRNGVAATKVNINAAIALINQAPGNDPTPPPPDIRYTAVTNLDPGEYYFGLVNSGKYGVKYGTNAHVTGYGFNVQLAEVANTTISSGLAAKKSTEQLSEDQLVARASSSCGSMYQLSYKVYDIDYTGEVALYINNSLIKRIEPTGNNTLKSRKVEFCGNKLKVGKNLIEFRKNSSTEGWGVTNILLEFVDRGSISLALGTKNTSSYGYGFGSNRHRSQLVVKFTKPSNNNDLIFSLTGWDIDHEYETSIFLNDKVIGYLTKACSSCFNGGDRFVIEASQLQAGQNQLTFIQRSPDTVWNGFQDEKWGVTDLQISQKLKLLPLLGAFQLFLDDEEN